MYFWKMSLYKKFVSGKTEWELIYKFLFCFLFIYVIKSTFRFHTLFCVFQGSVFCFFAFIIHSFKLWKRLTSTFFWSHSMLKNFEKFGFGGFIQTFLNIDEKIVVFAWKLVIRIFLLEYFEAHFLHFHIKNRHSLSFVQVWMSISVLSSFECSKSSWKCKEKFVSFKFLKNVCISWKMFFFQSLLVFF